MKKIHIEFSDERLITPSGLVFVGQILGKSSFVKKINRAPISKDYLQKQIKNGDVLLTYIGMLCQGKPQYEAVREMMDDPDYYKYALGISYAIPSAETLRQRFDMIGDSLRKDIQQANVDMLREMHIEPTALDNGFVPVDIDVTPFDNSKSNKEGVSRTYKGFDGYAPIMAYPVPCESFTTLFIPSNTSWDTDLEKASEIHCSALAFSLYNKYGFNTFPSLQKLV